MAGRRTTAATGADQKRGAPAAKGSVRAGEEEIANAGRTTGTESGAAKGSGRTGGEGTVRAGRTAGRADKAVRTGKAEGKGDDPTGANRERRITETETTGSFAPPPEQSSKMLYLEKKENERVLRRLQKQVSLTEEKITAAEKELEEMNTRLASGDVEIISDPAFYSSYEEKKREMERLLEAWEEAHQELESFMDDYINDNDN